LEIVKLKWAKVIDTTYHEQLKGNEVQQEIITILLNEIIRLHEVKVITGSSIYQTIKTLIKAEDFYLNVMGEVIEVEEVFTFEHKNRTIIVNERTRRGGMNKEWKKEEKRKHKCRFRVLNEVMESNKKSGTYNWYEDMIMIKICPKPGKEIGQVKATKRLNRELRMDIKAWEKGEITKFELETWDRYKKNTLRKIMMSTK
jgi:hypothetical protein